MTEATIPRDVLLVEDNPLDARLLQEYFAANDPSHHIHRVRDGESALSFLYHGVEYTNAPRPDVVLLDLHLPEMSGFEVLAAIKQHEHLRDIPVIVLTGSNNEDDIQRAYDLQANCYLEKPHDSEGFGKLMEAIEQFWLRSATLPKRG
ncbi:MAG: response regulator [Planctomycetaceae bacterium]|nr:response regulator [Planctomycetales bacterium]MCB9873505.1 response regulator [Planctomycetaceae bacterium]MCB9940415.1 response regulator [Planctomycetaceae bacterium]HRX82052.1 response regulator [Pirellulaceae bacterium]